MREHKTFSIPFSQSSTAQTHGRGSNGHIKIFIGIKIMKKKEEEVKRGGESEQNNKKKLFARDAIWLELEL
jgi:hypothetical protein